MVHDEIIESVQTTDYIWFNNSPELFQLKKPPECSRPECGCPHKKYV